MEVVQPEPVVSSLRLFYVNWRVDCLMEWWRMVVAYIPLGPERRYTT
ncbi:hypothetical protein ACXHJ2_20005 [Paenibacillus sp. ALE3]|nr:hypothetical protein [Paenibacillus sp. EKM207P]